MPLVIMFVKYHGRAGSSSDISEKSYSYMMIFRIGLCVCVCACTRVCVSGQWLPRSHEAEVQAPAACC